MEKRRETYLCWGQVEADVEEEEEEEEESAAPAAIGSLLPHQLALGKWKL